MNTDQEIEMLLFSAEQNVVEAEKGIRESYRKGRIVSAETVVSINNISKLLENIRNLYIYKLAMEGVPQKHLAEKFDLSTGRISQIVKLIKEKGELYHSS